MRQCMLTSVAVLAFVPLTALGQSPYQQHDPQQPQNVSFPASAIKEAPAGAQPAYTMNGGCCDSCGPQMSGRVEYLIWWVRDAKVTPLVTTGSTDLAGLSAGILNQPGTSILFGGDSLDHDKFTGGRLSVESWLDADHCRGIQASGFVLENRSILFGAGSDDTGNPVLGIPFFDVGTDAENIERAAFPTAFAGRVDARYSTKLWGAEINALGKIRDNCGCRVHGLVGIRFAQLEESLALNRVTTILDQGIAGFNGELLSTGDSLSINDDFSTRNNFWGAEIGVTGRWSNGRLSADAVGKVAFGATRQKIRINGFTTVNGPGIVPATANAGLFAVGSNIGHYEEDSFSVIPELGFTLGFDVTSNVRVFAGYTLIYWSDVARPGDQINRQINTNQVPGSLNFGVPGGPLQPIPILRETDFWAQGITFGLEFRY